MNFCFSNNSYWHNDFVSFSNTNQSEKQNCRCLSNPWQMDRRSGLGEDWNGKLFAILFWHSHSCPSAKHCYPRKRTEVRRLVLMSLFKGRHVYTLPRTVINLFAITNKAYKSEDESVNCRQLKFTWFIFARVRWEKKWLTDIFTVTLYFSWTWTSKWCANYKRHTGRQGPSFQF